MIEAVPNISEGRDADVVKQIVAAATSASDVHALHVDMDADANRTVCTFVGGEAEIAEGMFRFTKRAFELIDMSKHSGVHPRLGAVDVLPFVPLSGSSIDSCVRISRAIAERIGAELKVPVYLYGSAAKVTARANLSSIRKGEYEGLLKKLSSSKWRPDFGPADFVPKTGAITVGARNILIAFNATLASKNIDIAKNIAAEIRESGTREKGIGLLPELKAIGWFLPEFGCVQVSCNLTNYQITGLDQVFDACKELAQQYGTIVTGSELIGLVPKEAMLAVGRHAVPMLTAEDELIQCAITYLNLNQREEFVPETRILEYCIAAAGLRAA